MSGEPFPKKRRTELPSEHRVSTWELRVVGPKLRLAAANIPLLATLVACGTDISFAPGAAAGSTAAEGGSSTGVGASAGGGATSTGSSASVGPGGTGAMGGMAATGG